MRVGEIEGLRKSRQSAGARVVIIGDLSRKMRKKRKEKKRKDKENKTAKAKSGKSLRKTRRF